MSTPATKKRLIIDNQVQGTVNIVVTGDVPVEEAIRIIEINLLLNGYTMVPVEGSNIVKVVGSGKNPRTAAIPIISDELLLPDGEQVVTYITKLRYCTDPTEVQQTLSTFVVPAPGALYECDGSAEVADAGHHRKHRHDPRFDPAFARDRRATGRGG